MRQHAWEDARALLSAPSEVERAAIKKCVEEETLDVIDKISPLLTGWISLLDILKALLRSCKKITSAIDKVYT
jgi:hypothetical protein